MNVVKPKRASGRSEIAAGLTMAAVALALGPSTAVAQEPEWSGAASLRAVERLDPSSGASQRSLLRPLTPGERLRVESALREADQRPGEVDGAFDDVTARALRRFQRANDLTDCGCVNLATVEALGVDVHVVMTEIAAAGQAPATAGTREAMASAAGVEIVYPSTATPAPAYAASDAAGEGDARSPVAGRAGAAGPRGGDVPVSYPRDGVFRGWTVGVPFLVVDSAGNLVPFAPGVPVVRPGAGGSAGPPRVDPFSRHRVPLPPIRGGGRPPAGSGGGGGV